MGSASKMWILGNDGDEDPCKRCVFNGCVYYKFPCSHCNPTLDAKQYMDYQGLLVFLNYKGEIYNYSKHKGVAYISNKDV